ncbi:MAG: hypothetical protein KME54_08305 [Tolypothrix brevis GSE-NOS-MK-07-07A]|jgi:hypothetical protein|nr:hypothetical protein [Tolypothrix brevis GSE-NOS-MK-07-07A]
MTILDRRRQLQQQIAQLPDDQLTQVEQYLAFLSFQKTVPSQSQVTKSPSTGASILASLEQPHTPPDSPEWDEKIPQPPEDFAAKIAEIKQRGDRSQSVIRRDSTGQDLLKFAGSWLGNDLETCLEFLDATRSKAKF